jgi:hypothetical protein
MSNVPARATSEDANAGTAPWDIGRPQEPLAAAADRVTGPVLDAGCGTGGTALFFAARGLRAQVVERHGRHPAVVHRQDEGRLAGAGREVRAGRRPFPPQDLREGVAEDPVQPIEGVDADPRRQPGECRGAWRPLPVSWRAL